MSAAFNSAFNSCRSNYSARWRSPEALTEARPFAVRNLNADRSVPQNFEGIVGSSPLLMEVLRQVHLVAPTDSTVLIQGETGTGKELIAQAIHQASSRRNRPFVKLNCAAIPCDLLESELFGHERGAFTGAIVQKLGRFEIAHTGTLFLDEIGDIPPALQPKLLRVLQEREFERLGSGQIRRVDIRLIAATHRDLTEMVNENAFRSDLYFRLNVFPIVLPPLRERCEDIVPLVRHYVELFAQRMGKRIDHIPNTTLAAFRSYPWPGNVRELQNLIERAVILTSDDVLPNPLPPAAETLTSLKGHTTLKGVQQALILRTLEQANWVVGGANGAAARLGIKRTTLIAKMKKLGISRSARPRLSELIDDIQPGVPVDLGEPLAVPVE